MHGAWPTHSVPILVDLSGHKLGADRLQQKQKQEVLVPW